MLKSEERVKEETVSFPSNGETLRGTVFWPRGPLKSSLVIHAATCVPQSFYHPFAKWAAEQGHLVLTYDYRDFGKNEPKTIDALKASKANMMDWAICDQQAALDYLVSLAKTPEVHVIGQSLGGLGTPFHENTSKIDRMTTVASGPTHLYDHSFPYIFWVGLFWHILGPFWTRAKGYFVGSKFGMAENMPSDVFWTWRQWCNERNLYEKQVEKSIRQGKAVPYAGPMRIISFEDDQMVPTVAADRLTRVYSAADIERIRIQPKDYGLRSVGHLNSFRTSKKVLWPTLLGAV